MAILLEGTHLTRAIYIYTLGVKDYKKNGLTRGPERELPLLQPVKIELNWTSRVYIDTIDIYIYNGVLVLVMLLKSGALVVYRSWHSHAFS